MTKKYQVEIITPSPRDKSFRPVFDEFSEEEKPCYERMVEQFNRRMESPWQARIVVVEQIEQAKENSVSQKPIRKITFEGE